MNWIPAVAVIVFIAALIERQDPFHDRVKGRPLLPPALPKRTSGVVRRSGAIAEWPIDDGIVQVSPSEAAALASIRLGRRITPEVFALAAMIGSEAGGMAKIALIGVAWAAKNRAAQERKSVLELLAPDGHFAQQDVGPRYASTAKPPTAEEIALAEKVIAGKIADPTSGAVQFDSPALQRFLISQGKKRHSPEEIAAKRKAEGKTQIALPGIQPEKLRFWAMASPTHTTLGYNESRSQSGVSSRTPEASWDLEVFGGLSPPGGAFEDDDVGQWWLPTPFMVARNILLHASPAQAADIHTVEERKPLLPDKPMPTITDLANAASGKLGRMVDPRAIVLAAAMAAHGAGKPMIERASAGHIVVNRARADNKRIFELAAPDGKLGKKGDAGRVFSSHAVPTLEEVQIAEKIMSGEVGDPTGGKTSLGWILPPRDGLVGHDETLHDAAERAVAVSGLPPPGTPTPKLAQALADKWGGVWGVPPPYIMTIAEIESELVPSRINVDDPRAAKLGGAWGLMQITYRTGEDLIRWVKKSGEPNARALIRKKWTGRAADLLDPELNVMLGSFYLAKLFREFRSIELVAAAYHAGPGAVRTMMRIWGRLALGPYGRTYVAKAQSVYPRHGGA